MRKQKTDPGEIAKKMIVYHGIRAAAVAEERANEARAAADPRATEHWLAIRSAIAEIRAH